jgi:cytochrome P450
MLDPPEHDRLRKLVSRVFTPRAIGRLEPMIREVVVQRLDSIDGRERFDAIEDFAAPFPVEIICRMLGVPAPMRQQVRHWIDRMLTREPGSIRSGADAHRASVEMGTYFYELVREKRAHPAEDMLTRLTEVELETDEGATKLDDVEIAGFGALLGGAGAETVTKLMGNAVVLFDQHPDQWRTVLEDPARLPGAVEEILRYLPPSQYQGRFAFEEVQVRGEVIPAGSPVLLITGAACRDPRAFEDPDRFDITRPPSLSLGFGHGIHSCLGAALARTESRIALEELGRRHPRFSIDHDGLERVRMINVAGYSRVPIEVAPS